MAARRRTAYKMPFGVYQGNALAMAEETARR